MLDLILHRPENQSRGTACLVLCVVLSLTLHSGCELFRKSEPSADVITGKAISYEMPDRNSLAEKTRRRSKRVFVGIGVVGIIVGAITFGWADDLLDFGDDDDWQDS